MLQPLATIESTPNRSDDEVYDLEPWPMAFAELLIGLAVVIVAMAGSIGFFCAIALAVSIFSPLM